MLEGKIMIGFYHMKVLSISVSPEKVRDILVLRTCSVFKWKVSYSLIIVNTRCVRWHKGAHARLFLVQCCVGVCMQGGVFLIVIHRTTTANSEGEFEHWWYSGACICKADI